MKNTMAFIATLGLVGGMCGQSKAGLVGLYRFENSANLGQDSSSQHNDLAAFGGATYSSSGQSGGGLALDGSGVLAISNGSGGKVENAVPTAFPLNDESYTLSAWINTGAGGSNQGIIGWGLYGSGGRVNALRTDGTGVLNYWWSNDIGSQSVNVADNTWHFVAATYDNGSGKRSLYVDGSLLNTDSPGSHHTDASNFRIGKTFSNEFFTGRLDDVAIFNEALSASALNTIRSGDFSNFGVTNSAVPEPSTLVALGTGLVVMAGVGRVRRGRRSPLA